MRKYTVFKVIPVVICFSVCSKCIAFYLFIKFCKNNEILDKGI